MSHHWFERLKPCALFVAVVGAALLNAPSAFAQKDPVYKPKRDMDPKSPSQPRGEGWGPGGFTLTKREWDPKKPSLPPKQVGVSDSSDALLKAFNEGWKNEREEVERATVAELGRGDAMGRGYTLRHIQFRLADRAELSIGTDPSGIIVLKYVLRGNSLSFSSTMPGGADRAFDPEFDVTFDLTVPVKLSAPTETGPLTLQSALGQVSNASVKPRGPVAKVGVAVLGLFNKNVPRLVEARINQKTTDLTKQISSKLALINGMLEGLAKTGYTAMEVRADERRNKLLIVVTRSGAIPEGGAGSITGTVRWKKTYGHPQAAKPAAYSEAFDVVSEVQIASRGPLDFTGPSRRTGEINRQFADMGDFYECRYTISKLPLDVPVRVTVVGDKRYKWVSGTDPLSTGNRYFRPLGWSGLVTLKQPLKISTNTQSGGVRYNPVGRSKAQQIDFEMYVSEPPR